MSDDGKRLIPINISCCGNNKYSVKVDENEPYTIECDENSMRKAILRMKMKNGDGETIKRSSKNGTYKGMIGNQGYCWKSKCPTDVESFKKLLETVHIEENILNLGDMLDLIEDTLIQENNFNEQEIDKILDWASVDDGLIQRWNKLMACAEKDFIKKESMFWQYFDVNCKKAF